MVLGIPVAAVFAWYHGEKGRQRVSGPELTILAVLLVGLVGVFTLLSLGDGPTAEVGAASEQGASGPGSAPGIAVLPAIASGEAAEDVGDGLVTLLATGLDAVPGWRAVSPRTVRARWTERVAGDVSPDEPTVLEIARASGGQYAVLPTVTVLGTVARVVAEVHDLRNSGTPQRVTVEGDVSSLLDLADVLAVRTLSTVLEEEGEIPSLDLARVASQSSEAVRHFLAGEVFYRDFQLAQARDAFNRAIEHDSAFALAHYRLYEVHNWGETWDTSLMTRHRRAALEHVDRLNEREALVVRALAERDRKERLRMFREAVTRFPMMRRRGICWASC